MGVGPVVRPKTSDGASSASLRASLMKAFVSGILASYMTFYATLSALILLYFMTILLDEFENLKIKHLAELDQRE